MLVTDLLVILCLFLLFTQFLKFRRTSGQLPPGPSPLPVIGNLWTLKFQLSQETLMQLAKTYGNIYTVWFGQKPIIVLNGCNVVRDALVSHSEELSGRPETGFIGDLMGRKGIGSSNGHTWKQQRRFGLMTLRNLGLGKSSLEQQIHKEAQHLLEVFTMQEGRPFDPTHHIKNFVANVISAMVFGHRFSVKDAIFLQLVESINNITCIMSSSWSRLYDAFPRLMAHLPGLHQKAFEWQKFLIKFTDEEIKSHRERERVDKPQDFIDFYDTQLLKTRDDPNSTFSEESMTQVVSGFFLAGTETTSTTLRWALLYMVVYPEIQEKVQKELDAILGPSEIIHYEDRKRLPYTNAVIHEILRYSNIAGTGLVRVCVKETNLQGFNLSKGTVVLPNLASALFDPEHWKTPQQFNPGNFLDEDGNFMTNDAFLPFSAGHHVCLGEQLARTEIFIFFCNVLRMFKLQLPPGIKKSNLDITFGAARKPYPYKICAVPR